MRISTRAIAYAMTREDSIMVCVWNDSITIRDSRTIRTQTITNCSLTPMNDIKLRLSTVLIIVAIASAAAFALGRSTSGSSTSGGSAAPTAQVTPEPPLDQPTTPGQHDHPSTPGMGMGGGSDLPPGHPPIDPNAPPVAAAGSGEAPEAKLAWKVPPRWQVVPNTSSMRLATYKVPHAPSDKTDADVSVSQAGGAIAANVERWIGQFDEEAQKSAKQTKKKVAGLDVTIVEVEGSYAGMGGASEKGSALLGAIVATPGMPHFFKITGPAATVKSARQELDTLLSSMTTK